jgi:acetate kinase
MNVLVVNCGSSSVKVEVLAVGAGSTTPERLFRADVERIGAAATVMRDGARQTVSARSHVEAVNHLLDDVTRALAARGARLEAVGHRVVHGGPRFTRPALLDGPALDALESLETLAPLHNRPALEGIRACRERLGPGMPMVAVFDTAFHASLPEHAWRYALPVDVADRHSIRRYGFHGTSCRWAIMRWAALTGRPVESVTAIVLHLGNGCSATAVRGGRSVDTSMGLTPLEGLVMGTRAGDLDPAVVGHLARAEKVSIEEVEHWLNERSGLLGLSGRSRDMRELLAAESHDARAQLAVSVFCYRVRKYVGAYLAVLGRAEALIFTGGIGEHAPEVRTRICGGLEWCGLRLDDARNTAAVGVEARISPDGTAPAVAVIPADEAAVIARDTAEWAHRARP